MPNWGMHLRARASFEIQVGWMVFQPTGKARVRLRLLYSVFEPLQPTPFAIHLLAASQQADSLRPRKSRRRIQKIPRRKNQIDRLETPDVYLEQARSSRCLIENHPLGHRSPTALIILRAKRQRLLNRLAQTMMSLVRALAARQRPNYQSTIRTTPFQKSTRTSSKTTIPRPQILKTDRSPSMTM